MLDASTAYSYHSKWTDASTAKKIEGGTRHFVCTPTWEGGVELTADTMTHLKWLLARAYNARQTAKPIDDSYRSKWTNNAYSPIPVQDDTRAFHYRIHPRDRLRDQVNQLCGYARFAYDIEDLEALHVAQKNANILIDSGLFSEDFSPDVNVDQYGEISFTKRFSYGYIDMGVCGDGELSFHVRNDRDPSLSCFGDQDFTESRIPNKLVDAINSLIQIG